MSEELDKKKLRIKRIKKIAIVLVGLFLMYTIVGFWVVPPLLKPKVEEQLANLLGRKVTIEEMKLNPLLFTSTTANFTIYEIDGQPFAGFGELFVNVQLSSIFKWAATVREIRVQNPFGVLKVLPGNKLNIEDILAKLSAPSAEPTEKEEKGGLPRAIIERFQVIDGKVTVENHLGQAPIIEVFEPITFELANLSTLKGREGDYQFVGVGPLEGQFELAGNISVNPLRIQGNFATEGTHIYHFFKHVEEQVSFRIQKGTVETSGDYTIAVLDGQLDARVENVSVGFSDFELIEKGKEEVLISVPTLSIQEISADVNTQEIVVGQIRTADATIKSWFRADGSTELQQLFQPDIEKWMAMKPPETTDTEPEPGQPWTATLNSMQVTNWKLILDDLTGTEPLRETFTLDSLTVENAGTKKDQQGSYAFSGTGPSGGTYRLDGNMTVDPVWVQGSCTVADVKLAHFWEHIKAHVSFQIMDGVAGAGGEYTLALKEEALDARLEGGRYELNRFELVEKGKKDVLISIPALSVEEVSADVKAREVSVGRVQLTDGKIKSWLSADGTFELQKLFLADLDKLKKQEDQAEKEPEASSASPWQLSLQKLEVNNLGLSFEDRTLSKPATLTVDNLGMVLENLSNQKDSQGKVRFTLQVNQSGSVTVNGSAGINPVQANMTVSTQKIALQPFQPYVDDAVNAQILKGSTSSKGSIQYRQKGAKPQIRYKGEVSVDDVEIQDVAKTKDFITLAQFKASGIALDLIPNKLYTADVLVDRPHARVTIDENGMVNVVNTFAPSQNKTGGGGEEKNLLQRLVDFLIVQFKGPMPMQVDRVKLLKFTADFVDASVSPNFNTNVEIRQATVTGLSSDPSAKADFKMEGSIDNSAAIQGTGQMNPMNALKYSQVNFSMKDFQLPPVSPYAGKFIGYNIDKGSLHTDLKYQVKDDKVQGDNIIHIDQLELGEGVDSPDAINLPIKLGIALLKDSSGRISVQVPVEGDVKDPQFNFGDAIQSALTGTIKSAGEDPFSTITEIDGFAGEELRTIAFDFGSSELQDSEIQKLQALNNFLKERTSILLEIMGTADRKMDALALAGELTETDPKEDTPSPEEKAQREEEEAAIVESFDVRQLEQLAKERFDAVRAYLVEKAMLDAGRIEAKPTQINDAQEPGKGLVELSLSAE